MDTPKTSTAQRRAALKQLLSRGRAELLGSGTALLAGFLGALASALVMIALRLLWGTPTLPELVGERLLPLLPVGLFIQLLVTFQPHSKTGPLGLALLSQLALGVILGPLFHKLARISDHPARFRLTRRSLVVAGIFILAMEVLAILIFWPVLGESLVGYPIGVARLLTCLSALLTFTAFVGVMLAADYGLRSPTPNPSPRKRGEGNQTEGGEGNLAEGGEGNLAEGGEGNQAGRGEGNQAELPLSMRSVAEHGEGAGGWGRSLSRRRALVTTGVTVVGAAVGLAGLDALLQAYLMRSNLLYEGAPTPGNIRSAITPTEDFYIVSKNVLDPEVIADHWRMEVTGLVKTPRAWDYAALRRLPAETRAITLECISNNTGEHLMSTAQWHGVTLQALLNAAGGVQTGGKHVIFRCVDGYASSLPLDELLAVRTLLAWQMNGANLTSRHGFPLRAVVPGRYGEQSAKWLTQIEISDQPFKGFYQSQGWSDAPVSTTSRIDIPMDTIPLAPVTVAGIAYAGTRGIQRVEVSADNGLTWQAAQLQTPLSDQTWVFWTWNWTPPAKGSYTLVVRATDGTGQAQTADKQGVVPRGATGLHHVKVQVK